MTALALILGAIGVLLVVSAIRGHNPIEFAGQIIRGQ